MDTDDHSNDNNWLVQANGGFRQLGWARLTRLFPSSAAPTIKLFQDISHYGAEPDPQVPEGFVFDQLNFRFDFFLQQISRKHFTIERSTVHGRVNLSPARIVVHGINGLFLNEQNFVDKKQSRILNHGDVIGLRPNFNFFQFLDDRVYGTEHLPPYIRLKYHVDDCLGQGGQSTVRKVFRKSTQMSFAMKITSKVQFAEESKYSYGKRIQHMIAEVEVMKTLQNINVIRFFESSENPEYLCIIMELANLGDMLGYMKTFPEARLPEEEAKFCVYQISQGLKYIHDNGVCHRDLKLENIFVCRRRYPNEKIVVKIADFGYAKFADGQMLTQLGTKFFMAPEVLDLYDGYTNKADIWTLGCLIFACLSGSFPFHSVYGDTVSQQIRGAAINFDTNPCWKMISNAAKELIAAMVQLDPEARPAMDDVLQFSWFHDNNLMERVQFLYR